MKNVQLKMQRNANKTLKLSFSYILLPSETWIYVKFFVNIGIINK